MAQILDGISATPTQTGARIISYPLQGKGNYYARQTRRSMICAPATAYTLRTGDRFTVSNLLNYSEALTNAFWSTSAATVTYNVVANPQDGALTASKLMETAINTEHRIGLTSPFTFSAVANTFSCCVKSNGRTWVKLRANDGTTEFNCFFDIGNGVVGTSSNATGTLLNLGNGWMRCSITFTPLAAAGSVLVNLSTDGSTISYAGDTAQGIYLFGIQLETASAQSAYVAVTAASRSVTVPLTDPDDPFAFIVDEQEPDAAGLELGVARWNRIYTRVPSATTYYSSRAITKPVVPNQSTGTITVSKQDTATDLFNSIGTGAYYNTALFTPDNSVYGPLKSATCTTAVVATGGTFTVSYRGQTTSNLAYNASCTSVATAINGLSTIVADGITVTVNGGVGNMFDAAINRSITLTVGTTTNRITVNAANLTGVTAKVAFTVINSSSLQTVYLANSLACASHGFAGTGILAACSVGVATTSTTAYLGQPNAVWSVIDANTLACVLTFANANSLVAERTRGYTPGVSTLVARVTERYYLPNYTPGITTPADIPIASPKLSDADVLAAVATSPGYQPVEFKGPDLWEGPIYQTIETDVNFDAL